MKKFIVLMVFAIGMFAMLPSTSSGSAPPGQSSFITDQSVDLTAMVNDGSWIVETRLIASLPKTTPICREGGGVVILEDIFADQRHLNLFDKPVSVTLNFTQYCIYDFRLCTYIIRMPSNKIQRNNVSVHPVRIRADTQDV